MSDPTGVAVLTDWGTLDVYEGAKGWSVVDTLQVFRADSKDVMAEYQRGQWRLVRFTDPKDFASARRAS